MWETFSERPKLNSDTFNALKRYIIRDRERKKQELEQDKVHERLRKERELKKKREEEKTLTIEQTKEQIAQIESKLESLKDEKHGLFSQLKKVLHQEVEMRNRAQQKEQQQEQQQMQQQQYQLPAGVIIQGTGPPPLSGHAQAQPFLQSHLNSVRTSKYMNVSMHQAPTQGVKRAASPAPSSTYSPYASSPYHSAIAGGGPGVPPYASPSPQGGSIKQEQPYSSSEYGSKSVKSEQGMYAGAQAAGHIYAGSQPAGPHIYSNQAHGPPGSSVGGKYVSQAPTPGQTGFSQYPGGPQHFSGHNPGAPGPSGGSGSGDQYQGGGSYSPRNISSQRRHQTGGYSTSHAAPPGTSMTLQQQLEHASQRSGFVEGCDKFKMHQAMVASQQQQLQQLQQQQQQLQVGSKGSIVTGTVGKAGNLHVGNPPPPKGGGSIVMGNPMRPPLQQQGSAPPPGPQGAYNLPSGGSHVQQVTRLPAGYGQQNRY